MNNGLSRARSLVALRSFVEIARTGTFVGAAKEMNLTPSALSHQLSRLEEELGVRLLDRTPRGVALTRQGQRLYADMLSILSQLNLAITRAQQSPKLEIFRVGCFRTQRWLLRRLSSFQRRWPDVDVHITRSLWGTYTPDKVDCAVLFGTGEWKASCVEQLFRETLVIVCSQDFDPEHRLGSPSDLATQQLLMAPESERDWRRWLDAAEAAQPDSPRYLVLESRHQMIEAAISGLGIAVVDPMIVREELSSGILRQVFPTVAEGSGAYYLVYGDGRNAVLQGVVRFRDWILEEIRESEGS